MDKSERTTITPYDPSDESPPMLTTDADMHTKAYVHSLCYPVYDSGEHQAHIWVIYPDTLEHELDLIDAKDKISAVKNLSIGDSLTIGKDRNKYNFSIITRIR